jgi:hypothetical protein
MATFTPPKPVDRAPNDIPPPAAGGPWPVDVTGRGPQDECDCRPTAPPGPPPPCTRTAPPKADCCELLIDLLTGDPKQRDRQSRPELHKPKTPPKVKVANLCCDWPLRDSVGPLMVLLYERVKKKLPPQTAFEKGMYAVFEKFTPAQNAAVQRVVAGYRELPDARRCVFETRFDNWPDETPLDGNFINQVFIQEILAAGRYAIFGHRHPGLTVGFTRLWEQTFGTDLEGQESKKLLGPWPWTCAVNPGADDVNWYKNTDFVYPDKSDINKVAFGKHEFDQTCKPWAPNPSNPTEIKVDCVDNVSSPGAGGMSFQACRGGFKYEYHDPNQSGIFRCLKVPPCVAGQGVALRGFNFTSLACTVVIKKVGGGFPDMVIKAADVLGDDEVAGHAASCSVRDVLTFTIPRKIPDGLNDRPIIPGQYTVEVHVPNDSHYAPEPGSPPTEFVSNQVVIEIVPPTDIPYQVWFDRGNCYQETSGWGSDEAWFSAFTATYRGNENEKLQTSSQTIFQEDDLDSGDWIGFTPASGFSGKLGAEEAVAIAVLGLEIDNEQAAKDQVTDFGKAFLLFYKEYAAQLATAEGLASLAGAVVGGPLGALIAAGVAAIVIFVAGLFFAWGAPADPIGYDVLVFDQVSLFQLTTPGQPIRTADSGRIGNIDWSSYPKGSTTKGMFTAEYREERQYWSGDEESRYGLEFYVNQTPV